MLSRRGELTSGRDRHNYLTRVRRVAGRALDLAGNGGGSSALQVVDLEVVRHPVHGAEPAHADPTELRCRLRKKVGSAMCAHRLGLADDRCRVARFRHSDDVISSACRQRPAHFGAIGIAGRAGGWRRFCRPEQELEAERRSLWTLRRFGSRRAKKAAPNGDCRAPGLKRLPLVEGRSRAEPRRSPMTSAPRLYL